MERRVERHSFSTRHGHHDDADYKFYSDGPISRASLAGLGGVGGDGFDGTGGDGADAVVFNRQVVQPRIAVQQCPEQDDLFVRARIPPSTAQLNLAAIRRSIAAGSVTLLTLDKKRRC